MTNYGAHIVQEVPTSLLIDALDGSVDDFYECGCHDLDCWECANLKTWDDRFLDLMQYKLDDCSQEFISSVLNNGQRHPICVRVEGDGTWTLGNGNHRFAVAVNYSLPTILVVFSEDHQYMLTEITSPGEDRPDDECSGCGCYTCHCDEMFCNECGDWECGIHAQCVECGEEYALDGTPCHCPECYFPEGECVC